MQNQLEKDPMPKEEEILAIVPESGEAGENGTRIIAQKDAVWVPNCVSYVLRYYAEREGRTLALLKKALAARQHRRALTGRRATGANGRRNVTLLLAPWLILVPTQVREADGERGTLGYVNASRPIRLAPCEKGRARCELELSNGVRVASLWTSARNEAGLSYGEYLHADSLLRLRVRLQEEERKMAALVGTR